MFADEVVVQSPESSSPGLAFLLATINGTDDWEQYWADLVANGVSVTAGWEDAYYGEFTAGGGDRSIVVSYASSPPAEVIFADPPVEVAPTGVLLDSCFRQIEFAGTSPAPSTAPRQKPHRLHVDPNVPGGRAAQHVRVPGTRDRSVARLSSSSSPDCRRSADHRTGRHRSKP